MHKKNKKSHNCHSSSNRESHRNYLPARQAAVQMSTLMWKTFLLVIGENPEPILLWT